MNFAVLICTYNKPAHLNRLLQSISESILLPDKILIISAGNKTNLDIDNYKFNIEIIHSEIANQSYQKQIGIKSLINNFSHIVFLDDDVLVTKNTFAEIRNTFKTLESNYLGIALNLEVQKKKYSFLENIFRKIFILNGYPLGRVLINGHITPYLESKYSINTEWANGISAWRNEALKYYGHNKIPNGYSAYEDVIFSYKVSRIGKIIFIPSIKVMSQELAGTKRLTSSQFFYATLWRLFFVKQNKLNFPLMIYSHLARTFEFIFKGDRLMSIIQRLFFGTKLLLSLPYYAISSKSLDKKLFLSQ